MTRRLAAILAADVVGYSRLMGADEARTLAALREFRALALGPAIAGHRGDLIKNMGDGWLVAFSSTVDAVNCALRLQEQLAADPLLRLRIGVHIGDVVHEDEDIFGDGVNIAARLQEFADPGGIAISGSAYDSLDGTLRPGFADAGPQELKNIARPVQIWTRLPPGGRAAAPSAADARIFPTLAIRPVERTDGRPEINILADAVAGDLGGWLGSSDWLNPAITGRPGADDYALGSTLRTMGDLLRLETVLTAPGGERLWSAQHDGLLSESFDWRDRVGRDIAANVFGVISDNERQRLFAQDPEWMSPADCLLAGVLEFYEVSEDALESALGLIDTAIRRDDAMAAARIHALRCIFAAIAAGYGDRIGAHLARVPELLADAGRLAGAAPIVALCGAIWRYRQDRAAGELATSLEDVLRRAPFDADVLCLGGWGYVWLGQPEQALDCFRKFRQSGQFSSLGMVAGAGLALAQLQSGREAAAMESAAALTRATCDFAVPYRVMAAAAGLTGDMAKAREALGHLLRLEPEEAITRLKTRTGFRETPANERFFRGLRAAGLAE